MIYHFVFLSCHSDVPKTTKEGEKAEAASARTTRDGTQEAAKDRRSSQTIRST